MLLKWINAFLCYRQQRVVVNGVKSDWAPVVSGVILRWPVGSRMLHQNTTVIRRVTTVRTERGVRLTVCQGDVS